MGVAVWANKVIAHLFNIFSIFIYKIDDDYSIWFYTNIILLHLTLIIGLYVQKFEYFPIANTRLLTTTTKLNSNATDER